jgi:hypothetical protein
MFSLIKDVLALGMMLAWFLFPLLVVVWFLLGCTPTADVRIHRVNGAVEKLETWRESGPSTYTVCQESQISPVASKLECTETQLR